MSVYLKSKFFIQSLLAFIGMPLFIWALGSLPARSFLKELLSIMTVLAFCQIIGQFFWTRTNRYAAKDLKMSKVINYH